MDCPALDEAPRKHDKAFAGPGFGGGAIDCNSSHSHERYAAGVGGRISGGDPDTRCGCCVPSAPRWRWTKSSTAPQPAQARQTFRVTHPFHPLCGLVFELVHNKLCWGIERVYYLDASGALRHLPLGCTSVAATDPFVAVAAGRAAFRVVDLLALADLLEGGSVKEIMPDM